MRKFAESLLPKNWKKNKGKVARKLNREKPKPGVGCACIRALVAKGWVQHKQLLRFTEPGDPLYYIVKTNVPREDPPGTIGIVLACCLICGHDIYPRRG